MATRTRYQNIILIILVAITVGFGALLIYNRTQPGIRFRDGCVFGFVCGAAA